MTAGSERASHSVVVPGYVVAERIGAGGFGEVYRARHGVIEREVAIKVLHAKHSADPAAMKRFVDEARAVNKISHPNIVEISDFGVLPDGRQYCVMELITGTTLRDVLRQRSRLPLEEALPILRGIAHAVDAAHAVGIAHRDLKPDNVFVLPDGGIKLIDFGLAKLTTDDAVAVTETGAVFGTPLYMSPEQCRGNAVTVATDAYSFGVLAYHVLVGEPPFTGEALELALHHLNDEPPVPSSRCAELGTKVDRVVLALMAKDPAARPASLVTALDALIGNAPLPGRRGKFPRRVAIALTAALVGGGGATVLAVRGCVQEQRRDCVLAEDKLAGVWDEETRGAAKARFDAVNRPDVQATWKRISEDLDVLLGAWAQRWDASCTGSERQTDPLLWAQRQACLENVLPAVRKLATMLRGVDASRFSHETTWDFVGYRVGGPDICTDEKQLRATPRPIAPAVRDDVAKLQRELSAVRDGYKEALQASKQELVDSAVVRMKEIEAALVKLGVLNFYEATWRGSYLGYVAEWNAALFPAARAAIADGIRRAEAVFDDAALTTFYSQLSDLERRTNSSAPVVEAAIAKAAASAGRIGRDPETFHEVVGARASLAARDGRFVEAIGSLRVLGPPIPSDPDEYWGYADHDSEWALRLGRIDEAIQIRRASVDFHVRKLGEVHPQVGESRTGFAFLLAEARRFDEAIAELDKVEDIFIKSGIGRERLAENGVDKLDFAARAGRPIEASYEVWRTIANRALERGDLELARRAHDHQSRTAPDRWSESAELGVYLALARGDVVAMKERAEQLRPSSELDTRRWWTAVADVFARNTRSTPVELAALRSVIPKLQGSTLTVGHYFAGLLELGTGHAQDAVKSLDASRAALLPARNFHMARVDAWLGHARVEAGDGSGAIAPLEESLAILANCCKGSHYFAPLAQFALARALVETGGDVARAKTLAEAARDGFGQLGGFWLLERERVVTWLASIAR